VWLLGTFPKYNKSENIPDVYQSWYSKISNQTFPYKRNCSPGCRNESLPGY
jgi:hypothetical protein